MKLKFNFNKRNKYKNICSIEGCNNSACGKYCNKHYHQIKRYGHIKTRTRFDKNEIIINDNVAKILLYDNNSTGVRKHIQKGKYISYQAYISINNKQINLGYFDTKEKAIIARKFAERKYNINSFSY